jgi:hypothetical protein
MKKKLAFLMIILSFAFAYGQEETAEISKEVTGVNMETLENSQDITVVEEVQDEVLNVVDTNLESNEVQANKEKLDVAKEQQNNNELENELSKDMKSENSIWKYLLGGALIILGVAAF